MEIAIYTLGCKVNQYETQAMERELERRGHTLVPFDGPADVYIINTCSVTAVSDKKSRNVVRRARRNNPSALVAVCGCYVQTHEQEASALGANLLMGTQDRIGFLDRLEALAAQSAPREAVVELDDPFRRRAFESLPAGGLEGRTRALLKAEDGCTNFCSYCIIPYARGPVRSLSAEAAQDEALRLAREGYRELVLTGIELSSWGRDLPEKPSLARLIRAVCTAAPDLRIRLGSLEPRTITEEFCLACVDLPNLCPHFHLSLQSGCDATLQRMNRKYDTKRYLESVSLLRRYFPECAITTDLIVGFPGETEQEFAATLEFLNTCAFAAMHIFPYSPRPGTPAASFPDQVSRSVKEDRARRAASVAHDLEQCYLTHWVGREVPVLFEAGSKGQTSNYMEVRAEQPISQNTLLPVVITEVGEGFLRGRPVLQPTAEADRSQTRSEPAEGRSGTES